MEQSRISKIETQTRHKDRVNIYIDGEFALGLSETVAARLQLSVGKVLTKERLEEVAAAEEQQKALDDAYRLLSFRSRSAKEITDRLHQKGYSDEIVTAVLERLTTSGYLDDSAFAAAWVSSRGKTRGSRLLVQELRQKGVDKETARETVDESRELEDEIQAALALAVRRVGDRPTDQSREAKAKLSAFLQRRGFGWDIIRPVLRKLYRDSDGDLGDDE